jgi:hypothetical protein
MVYKQILTMAVALALGSAVPITYAGGGGFSSSGKPSKPTAPPAWAENSDNAWHNSPWPPSGWGGAPSWPGSWAPWGGAPSAPWPDKNSENRAPPPGAAPWGAMPPWGGAPWGMEGNEGWRTPQEGGRSQRRGGMSSGRQQAPEWTQPAPPPPQPFYNAPDSSAWDSDLGYPPPGMGYPNWHPSDAPGYGDSYSNMPQSGSGFGGATPNPPGWSGGGSNLGGSQNAPAWPDPIPPNWPGANFGGANPNAPGWPGEGSHLGGGQNAPNWPGANPSQRQGNSPWPGGAGSGTPWPGSGSSRDPVYFDRSDAYKNPPERAEVRPGDAQAPMPAYLPGTMMGTPNFTPSLPGE